MTPAFFFFIYINVKGINALADTLLLVFDNLINKDRLTNCLGKSSGESFLDFGDGCQRLDDFWLASGI